jgi:hypothetical protein
MSWKYFLSFIFFSLLLLGVFGSLSIFEVVQKKFNVFHLSVFCSIASEICVMNKRPSQIKDYKRNL